jgi:hypothetical protein
MSGAPADITVRRSVIHHNGDVGLFVLGSSADVTGSYIHDTLAINGVGGRGVHAGYADDPQLPSELSMRTSVIERNLELGLHIGSSHATIEASVVRKTAFDEEGRFGRGIDVNSIDAVSTLDLQRSLVAESYGAGILLSGTDATLHAVVSRDTQRDAQLFSRGVQIQADRGSARPSIVEVSASRMEHNAMGVYADNSQLTMSDSIVRDTLLNEMDLGGRGVGAGGDSGTTTLNMHGVLVEDTFEAGVFVFDGSAAIDSCLVRNTAQNGRELLGDGIAIVSTFGETNATITATRVEQSARVAVSSFGAALALGGNQLVCQSFDLLGGVAGGSSFDDLGGNGCGCPEAQDECVRTDAALEPPAAVGGLE